MAYTTKKSLIDAIRGGDEVSWEIFYQTYCPLILFCASQYELSSTEGEELVQIVMLKFFKAGKKFVYDTSRGRFRDYLGKIINNAIIDMLRAKKRNLSAIASYDSVKESAPDGSYFEDIWHKEWRHHLFAQAVDVLRKQVSEKTFQAFELTVMKGLPAGKVAEFLSMTPGNVYEAKRRSMAALRKIMNEITRE